MKTLKKMREKKAIKGLRILKAKELMQIRGGSVDETQKGNVL
jgi:hypothetical protein